MGLTKTTSAVVLAFSFGILGSVGAEPLAFRQITVDAEPPGKPYYKMVGDVSGDGYKDIVVAGAKTSLVAYVWPSWQKVLIGDRGWDGVNGEIADVDGDGDMDVVMGGTLWFKNPGRLARLQEKGLWEKVVIDNQKAHDIELADLNQDGKLDVVARDQSAFGKNGNWIAIYLQESPTVWNKITLDCPHGEGIKLGDIDQDGDHDILLGGLWFQNPGDASSRWLRFQFAPTWAEPDSQVEIADFNKDGRPDIVLTPAELKDERYRVCWYEAPQDARQNNWTEHVIVPDIECIIHSLGIGDFDGDGDVDVAIAEMHQGEDPDEVSLFLNDDAGRKWQQHVLSEQGSHDIVVADVDGDGDLDIVGANHAGTHPLELWQNQTHSR